MKFSPNYHRWLRHKCIAFDTSYLITLLEEGKGVELADRVLQLAQKRALTLVTSTMTLLEVLVLPYRRSDSAAVNLYYGYLVRSPAIKLIPLTAEIADRAAAFRARYGLKTPDAIQLATAVSEKATLFLACDKDFRKQKEIEVGLL